MTDLPILYSFRRCPYAMRARMALAASGAEVMLREVLLQDKPPELVAASPKATVPVLVLSDGQVVEESLDVMQWALEHGDPLGWLEGAALDSEWISECDEGFKHWLDRYKYAERYPEHTAEDCRHNAEGFIQRLEDQLSVSGWMGGGAANAVDVALFPFIRQFAGVDVAWWQETPYAFTQQWLARWVDSALFSTIMAKYPRWESGQTGQRFPSEAPNT
ncbi:MAG: glutathione S-transferase [Gammaproteobacteria bacterium]|nr:glutathione S-transferase [Gammaproteobacteria bacterium]